MKRKNTTKMLSATLAMGLALSTTALTARADEEDVPAARTKEPEEKEKTKVHALIAGGLSYGELFGIGARATAIEGGLAIDVSKHVATTLAVDVELGKTSTGELPIGDVALFATLDGVLANRVRIGAGPQLSYFWMSRATTSDETYSINALGLGLRARVSVDLLRFDDASSSKVENRGIYLAISPDIEWLRGKSQFFDFTTGTVAWRANTTLGLRF